MRRRKLELVPNFASREQAITSDPELNRQTFRFKSCVRK